MPDSKPLTPEQQAAYDLLLKVRASTTVTLKPTPLLRDKVIGPDGEEHDFALRYYQVQGVFHLLKMKRLVLGDDTGLGKTIEAISALCYLWQTEPDNRVVILAPKSAIRQWAAEIARFTRNVKVFLASDTDEAVKGETPVQTRTRVYESWLNAPASEHPVLIMNYALLVRDWNHGGFQPPMINGKPSKEPVKPGLLDSITARAGAKNLVVIGDEAAAFKSPGARTTEIVRFLSQRAHRVYGLTATLLMNHLMEGFSIFNVIKPGLFRNKTQFMDDYCYVELQKMGGKKVPIIKGYKNLDHFKHTIDPFFIGRKKHMVAKDLPVLVTKDVQVPLNTLEDAKYNEALNGVLELGDGEVKDYTEHAALVSLGYCQQVVNSLTLLRFEEGQEVAQFNMSPEPEILKSGILGSKEQALADLVMGELDGEKVIVYTRYASLVPRLQHILKKYGVPSVRITGMETDDKSRQAAQQAFQDPKSDVKVIFITTAGSAAINLQLASATIYYDAPWSWGEYVQILGRMIRIGSIHRGVLAIHLVAQRPEGYTDRKTIDSHVLSLLLRKKALIDKVIGEGAVGALKFEKVSSTRELVRAMQNKRAA